ncbi:aminodeoxychorismate synthase component I [Nocardia sp. NRRL S-836]|uniref:aminodeoxychorismate synthase component I n=1 Tax=Nocardia sp. NRRL S-836 TaxID=1519492 RepID=UPI0006ADFB98|nr:aminodeoxychorismate synthase component I [Nocardia sp. NRRL S-836]KOV79941.1 aminobenzoate synthetase [Nocardia sp. NRRL S-836]
MRTLLIDNYDSFTFNLFQHLAQVNGAEPVVVHNDDPRFRLAALRSFDNVVISPGPGRPGNPADFGVCRAVIEHAEIPLLGVCLGHQGLCLSYGATVGPAPVPRHGIVSPVRHTGVDVFAGLPSPLDVVRYHSLAVTDLPSSLEAVAWSDDGVLMGVRALDRPAWGVQFHPESICTESGRDLLANFAALTPTRSAAVPEPVVVRKAAQQRPVHVRRLDLVVDAEEVFAALYGAAETAFWLDSGSGGRFSFFGDASGPLARVARYSVPDQELVVDGIAEHCPSFFSWLDEDLAAWGVHQPDVPFDFALGWVGYLGYELKSECGGDFAHRAEQPDASFVFADRALVIDHHEHTVHLLSLTDDDWFDRVAGVLHSLRPLPPATAPVVSSVRLRHPRAHYLKLIGACQEAITAGETYEVCLTNMMSWQAALDPWDTYRLLRAANPVPFGALLRFGELSVLSASPERFIRVDRDGVVESSPIKGTRPRGEDAAEDEMMRTGLARSVKDRAENLMIVDLVRNDLGTCAEVGSVEVTRLFDVETYSTVHQLVSTVRARLRPDSSAVRCVRAAFPGGSMTGAPKIRTMQILDGVEAGPRGVYSGALGYFSLNGAADFSIVIRTLVRNGDQVSFGVGGAVISLSEPDAEFEETAVKATAVLRLFGADFPGR